MPNEHTPGQPRVCSACGAQLQFRGDDLKRDSWAGTTATAIAAACLGHAWWQDLLWFLALFLPVAVVVSSISMRISRPKLEPYDGHKMIG